jgi:hypothetical protein
MSNDFGLTETSSASSFDQRWLASNVGLEHAQTGSLDLTDPLVQGIVDKFKGIIPAGTILGYNEGTKQHVIFDSTSADAFRKVIAGVLKADIDVTLADSTTIQKSKKAPVAVMNRADINRKYLPIEAQRTVNYLTTQADAVLVFTR